MTEDPQQQADGAEQEPLDDVRNAQVIALLVKRERDVAKAEQNVADCKETLKAAQKEYEQALKGIREVIQDIDQPGLFSEVEEEEGADAEAS